ncbi:alpha/beta fold hydrolase [Leptobacterium flavescens]|uniref:Alpha/beta fold hydrolase n=1 Tax=Leptobacterium flavescens TaxID=472055 RepID=A0A6P0UT86_9FLAO|nr:alpha/beta fold hydrolase [Leptobacterium flavescens]NER15208.1 alpha/beta fold hydrolase [Leptobacterium flavescens]
MKRISIILFTIFLSTIGYSQEISGVWNGAIQVGANKKINFIFKIEKKDTGYHTVVDVPTQRVTGIQSKATHFKDGELIVDITNVGMNYKGRYNKDKEQFEGEVTEGASSFPLILSRGNIEISEPRNNRPQEPVKPYPYKAEEVSFENTGAGISLAGTLSLPQQSKKHPAVILISGSGPQDRDETISGHKPFLVLADHLTRQGIAVLRYDDRGFGQSTGDHSAATTEDFATDVMSAVAYLKTRDDIDSNNIGLIGHSEGGIIAPLAANKLGDIAFVVSLAGTGISGTELSVIQSRTLRPFPVPDEEAYEKAVRKAIEIAVSDKEISVIKEELRAHYAETTVPILKNFITSEEELNKVIEGIIGLRTSKWSRYFYQYNPADEYAKLNCPVLSLNGSKDTQVEAKINQEGLRKALLKGKNPDFKILELPGLNHFFQECETGAMNEYQKIEQTFSPIALNEVSGWILERLK